MDEGSDELVQAYEQAIDEYRKFHCPKNYTGKHQDGVVDINENNVNEDENGYNDNNNEEHEGVYDDGNNGEYEDDGEDDNEPFEEIELFNLKRPVHSDPPPKKMKKHEEKVEQPVGQYPFFPQTYPWNFNNNNNNTACCSHKCCCCHHHNHHRHHSRHKPHKTQEKGVEDTSLPPRPPPLDGVTPELQSLLTSWFNAGYEMGVYHEKQKHKKQ